MGILKDTKDLLGIAEGDDGFDLDISIHINSAINVLEQLGLPAGDLDAKDDYEWTDLSEPDLNLVMLKDYVYLYVRRIFDPPLTGTANEAIQKNIDELSWRIMAQLEGSIDG